MNTLQIKNALNSISNLNTGVFPADKIPKIWTKPTGYVINTDNHDKPGKHWLGVFVNAHGRAIFFDSYGRPPIRPVLQRLQKNCIYFTYNRKQIQSFSSEVCGQYCILFLHCMSRGFSLYEFNRLFTDNYIRNDNFVREYCKKFTTNKRFKKYDFKGHGIQPVNLIVQNCCANHYL